jgi:uncharacterized protein DUF4255
VSTALAIGAASAVLRNVLDNGLIDAVQAVGVPVKVTVKAPDLIVLDDPQFTPQLNLFLYRVSTNPGWRNAELPSRDSGGRRMTNPPLALDLHYLLTAYGREDLHAEILLGYGMHLLHERPVLDRPTIRKALSLSPLDPVILPDAFQSPPNAGLAEQLEMLKVTWEPMDTEAMSKLWSAVQSHYRPSAAYQVSVVLIEAERPASEPLPVLTRDLKIEPSLVVPYPAVDSVAAPDGTQIAELGEQMVLHGHHLAGTSITVRLHHRLLAAPHELTFASNGDPSQLLFNLPVNESFGQPWPAGVWSVSVTLTPQGETVARTTNTAALLLAPVPETNGVPPKPTAVVTRNPTTQRVKIVTNVKPQVRPEQTVTVALNSAQATADSRIAPESQVEAEFAPIPPGSEVSLRLRVDGVDSRIIDYSGPAPTFRTDRQVTVP